MSRIAKAIYVAAWALICITGYFVMGRVLNSGEWWFFGSWLLVGTFIAPIITYANSRSGY